MMTTAKLITILANTMFLKEDFLKLPTIYTWSISLRATLSKDWNHRRNCWNLPVNIAKPKQ